MKGIKSDEALISNQMIDDQTLKENIIEATETPNITKKLNQESINNYGLTNEDDRIIHIEEDQDDEISTKNDVSLLKNAEEGSRNSK